MLSYASHPDPPMSPPLSPQYRINLHFSPQKTKRPEHFRHGSEVIQRPRPMSLMQNSPSKRSSVYVSEASVLLARRNSVVTPVSPFETLMSPVSANGDSSEFADHYAILELDSRASAAEIKDAYRRLRMVYFQSNAIKYRALCVAFDVLADPEAREEYDATYPTHLALSPSSSLGAVLEQSKHGRKDSGQHSTLMDDVEAATTQEEMTPVQEEEEFEETRNQDDPNWGLKRHRRLHEPLIGTEPYQSFVPILQLYEGRASHPALLCRRPTYTGCEATNAMPL
jgi:hypothetical protein